MLLFVLAGLSLVAAVSDGFEYELIGRIDRGESFTDAEVDFNDLRQGIIGLVQTGLYVALVVVFLMWFFRAYKNLPRLGAEGLRYKPGWAIGAWFVPILNFFRPKQIANDIWRGSDPELPPQPGTSWRDGPIARALLGWWWGVWIVSGILDNASFRGSLNDETTAEIQDAAAVTLAADAVTIPAALLCAAVVAALTTRQEGRARRLAGPPA